MIIRTRGSTYELDADNKRIRRLYGKAAPTDRQSADGDWSNYEEVSTPKLGVGLLIVWSYELVGEEKKAVSTYTSDVVEVNPDLRKTTN